MLLFAACSKEKTVDGNVNDKSNVTNQEDTSIEDSKTDESNSFVDDGSDNENDSSADEGGNSEETNNEASDSDKSHSDPVIVEREYNYDFEGKYWFAEEENEALYFNGFQYIYFSNGEVVTGGYKIVNNQIKSSQIAYSYSSNQVKTFHLAYDYEYTEDSFVLFKKHDDGGNRLGSISFVEIAQEDFNTLTKMTFSFTKLPVNTYWKDISSQTYSHSRPETIFHFDGTTLTAYEYGTDISKQKYSINEHSIILEPTRTQKQNFEHSGETTIEYKSDVIEDYSLSDKLLLINHIVPVYNMPQYALDIENTVLVRILIQIDEETAKTIINEKYIQY